MFVYTKVVIDTNTGAILESEGYEYDGPVAECKGDATARQSEQDQAAFNKTLMSTFQSQLAKQGQITDLITKTLTPQLLNPTGYSPEALTALRTSASDTNSGQYQNAQKALNDQLAARGGASALPSGVDAQLRASLAGAGAQQESQSQNEITLQNENAKMTNLWNAIDALSGNAQVLNPIGYAGGATSGSGAVANLSQAYTQSKQSQLLGALGSLAGGAGTGITQIAGKKFGL